MQQKPLFRDTFFSLNPSIPRPASVATEFVEDWEVDDLDDDEIISDPEDGDNSPRLSLNSVSSCFCNSPSHVPRY